MNKQVDLFNKVNKLLEYDKDPIGTTAWWSDKNEFLGEYDDWPFSRGIQSPLRILTQFYPSHISYDEFVAGVVSEIDYMSRGMD